jgi:glycine dehydrogenase
MAAMYAVYHGPQGLRDIAGKVHGYTGILNNAVKQLGYEVVNSNTYFDTLSVKVKDAEKLHGAASRVGINFRRIDGVTAGVTLDESVSPADLLDIVNVFATASDAKPLAKESLSGPTQSGIPETLKRSSSILHHPVFNTHHSETEMLRYIHHLQSKDLSLVHAMIPLGSCTMKLNSTSSMIPVTMPEYGNVHPFAPLEQVGGYSTILKVLSQSNYPIYAYCVPRNWRNT